MFSSDLPSSKSCCKKTLLEVRAAAVASLGSLGRHAQRAERLSAAEYASVTAEALGDADQVTIALFY